MKITKIIDTSQYITSREIRKLFDITKPTLGNWKRSMNFPLPAQKVSRHNLYSVREIMDWCEAVGFDVAAKMLERRTRGVV